jgi:hypothetical protein
VSVFDYFCATLNLFFFISTLSGGRISSLNTIFEEIGKRVTKKEHFEELKRLMSLYTIEASIRNEVESMVSDNLDWIAKNTPVIRGFLQEHSYNNGGKAGLSWIIGMTAFVVQFLVRK